MTAGSLNTRPSTPLQHDPTAKRPLIVGPDHPEQPYPVYLQGWVERGFGRGSKDLGCPTANLPDSSIAPYSTTLSTGVHYGYARVLDPAGTSTPEECSAHDKVYPMVMSIGWNPFYDNQHRTAEVHVLHDFPADFYGKELRVVILGFIRPEFNYAGLDALIKDINTDKEVSLRSVERPAYESYKTDPFFSKASTLPPPTYDPTAVKVKPEAKA
ncbi:riboflavin kinase [Meredithblackwellia eburnea MCA 4105]